jgi:voltage-gated potassium channel
VSDGPSGTPRVEARLQERVRRAVATRRVFPYLVSITVAIGLVAGFLVTLVDRKDFPNYGIAVWWAIVTLATVGYGDVVPTTALGRLVGSGVIILGVTFISFLTAIVTSLFLTTDAEKASAEERKLRAASEAETRAILLRLEERLTAIEAKLER